MVWFFVITLTAAPFLRKQVLRRATRSGIRNEKEPGFLDFHVDAKNIIMTYFKDGELVEKAVDKSIVGTHYIRCLVMGGDLLLWDVPPDGNCVFYAVVLAILATTGICLSQLVLRGMVLSISALVAFDFGAGDSFSQCVQRCLQKVTLVLSTVTERS